ncbi:hypothetical protein WMO40_20185 [Bacillaceae bacterium CLA-AA-H227]|uniref:Uncharacterized protein n=1 Tax=Robertmurraya yapensis (ex Hitch et al 2024) TaxID=3133160 RepID=A0ACC6SFW8_9BACI
MEEIKSKEDIIKLLLQYLPELSNSLNIIISLSHEYVEQKEPNKTFVDILSPEGLKTLGSEVNKIIEIIRDNQMDIKSSSYLDPELKDIIKFYYNTVDLILEGFLNMYEYIMDKTDSEEDLADFINKLYEGAQQIMQLVNIIVDK